MALTLEAERRPGESNADDLVRTVSSRVGGGGRTVTIVPPRVCTSVRDLDDH